MYLEYVIKKVNIHVERTQRDLFISRGFEFQNQFWGKNAVKGVTVKNRWNLIKHQEDVFRLIDYPFADRRNSHLRTVAIDEFVHTKFGTAAALCYQRGGNKKFLVYGSRMSKNNKVNIL